MANIKFTHLDLFSGIGGFHLGFEKAGFEIDSYFSEIDKYAIDVYKYNFKNSKYVGSVTDVRKSQLPKINLITFGSPCQDFSLAGKRRGLQGVRSSLISQAIRLISECRPEFFVWENVKGTFSSNSGSDFWAILKEFTNIGGYRLEWQLCNTKWFLPQNRERIYLVGCLGKGSGQQIFPITENNRQVDDLQRQQGNTCAITRRYRQSESSGSYIVEHKFSTQEVEPGTWRTHKDGEGFRKIIDNNCPAIPARAREDGSGQPVIRIKTNNKKGYEIAKPGDAINLSNPNSKTRRGRVGKGIAQTLDTGCEQAVIGYSRDAKGKVTSYHTKDIANTLHSSSGGGGNTDQYIQDKRIRRLTPIECERLQGFPENWTKFGQELGKISDSQRYKMCGNAVTVDVVAAVANKIKSIL
ncbi:MAG: putative cytosine-specific methyltransferase [Prokaryotic dsDNA virus sp.]|jgi:DNA (cytosine-5)-methyltransferase 1|nr:MAG: putative cytosine-specific methyltransferase [Prokaryotic dsDNA virus sp.]|tara:strand:+ start:206 stop:1438 length:1233 start_codon:yes stop_codon:yes gene_type:complete